MAEHVTDDLPALLSGELSREQTAGVVQHLRACDSCRLTLVGSAAANGALRLSARELAVMVPAQPGPDVAPRVPDPERTLPPLARPRGRRPSRRLLLAGAAALAMMATAGGIATIREAPSPTSGTAAVQTAALTAIAGGSARGLVTMRGPSERAEMTISTEGLSAPAPGQFYEVWLLDPKTLKMVGIGVLAPDGRASFRVPAGLVTAYRAVDVSLQRDNGDPRHSSKSVLRGRYS